MHSCLSRSRKTRRFIASLLCFRLITECSEDKNQEPLHETEDNGANANEVNSAEKSSPPAGAPATNALGRPMRKSASKFSAVKLLKAGLSAVNDDDPGDIAEWSSKALDKDISEDYVPDETVSLMMCVHVYFPIFHGI